MRLLLIADDGEGAAWTRQVLLGCGHASDHVAEGSQALANACAEPYDAILLDRQFSNVDALSLLSQLRAATMATPVLILSASIDIGDFTQGLQAGAADYVFRPFVGAELMARIHAAVRRSSQPSPMVLHVAGLKVDLVKRIVSRAGVPIDLQHRELHLLECLIRHAGRVVGRDTILEEVFDLHADPGTNIVETHMSRLRAKVSQPGRDLIHTVRGFGYRLGDPE